MIKQELHNGKYILRNATTADIQQMETVQQICFPTLANSEKLTAAQYQNHINVFPEGQLVVAEDEKVIASSATLRMHFPKIDHHLMEVTDNLWITNAHLPDGEWLYQFDMGVLPEYRGLGLSKALYAAHQDTLKLWGMKGLITVGMTIGYERYKDQYSIEEYCEKLKNFELSDPTVTPQRKAGFQWVQPVFNYLEDPAAGNCSIFLVWTADGVIWDRNKL
jgi:ribosomal protein S18 acetylase RimI-like enzyme